MQVGLITFGVRLGVRELGWVMNVPKLGGVGFAMV